MPYTTQILEPHPLAPASHHYAHHGRGGAGNKHSTPSSYSTSAYARAPYQPPPPSVLATSSMYSPKFSTGRGGAGNVLPASERAIFSFDEELDRRRARDEHAAPVYHIGRGGAGNVGDSLRGDGASITSRKSSSDIHPLAHELVPEMRAGRHSTSSGTRAWGRFSESFNRVS